MPMSFPDMESLEFAAKIHKFRTINLGETEIQYRNALADFVQSRDLVESMEIRTGKGWNEFDDQDNISMLQRGMNVK